MAMRRVDLARGWPLPAACLVPAALTTLLVTVNPGNNRDYVFLYLGLVAVLGLSGGLLAALVAAAVSFALVDFFFVRPVHTFEFGDSTDLVNLCVFVGAAALVGTLGSRRRAAQLRAESLARELQEANLELARLAETERHVRALEEADRLRREVLANVSHDLRTPLASILTRATSLQRKPALAAELHAEVGSIAGEARRLDRLVGELIEMTRIEGGIVELRTGEVDLVEALGAAAGRLRRESPHRRVLIDVATAIPDAVADWGRLGQILDNLLENADHAAPEGTPIRLSAVPHGESAVAVSVIDCGPGVAPELRDRIFERFVRGDDPVSRGHSGIGLGLPIVRGLVEAHGGRVWMEDAACGSGACFTFTLPAGAGWAR